MEQPIPDWLDTDFLAQCLQTEKDNQNIVVTNFTASLAAPAGNNYGGCVVRARVDYKDSEDDQELRTISLIVKSELTEGPGKGVLDSVKHKEPTFYKTFLPLASKLTNVDFAPRSLFSPKPLVTVMEDLREKGFLMADRTKQLDFEHCSLYMKAAASLHAISFAVRKKDPKLVEDTLGVKLDWDAKVVEMLKNMVTCGFKCFAEATERLERFKGYSKLIQDISPNLYDLVEEAQKAGETMKTLTQGDPWTTNMMFSYDNDGAVGEVRLIDFQGLTYTSPVNDLVLFIWSSANHEVRRNRRDDLYHIYCDSFNGKLQELKCTERMDFESLMGGIIKLSPWALQLVGSTLPFIFHTDPLDFAAFLNENVAQKNPFDKYYNEEFRNDHLPELLEQLETAGVLEYLESYSKTQR